TTRRSATPTAAWHPERLSRIFPMTGYVRSAAWARTISLRWRISCYTYGNNEIGSDRSRSLFRFRIRPCRGEAESVGPGQPLPLRSGASAAGLLVRICREAFFRQAALSDSVERLQQQDIFADAAQGKVVEYYR